MGQHNECPDVISDKEQRVVRCVAFVSTCYMADVSMLRGIYQYMLVTLVSIRYVEFVIICYVAFVSICYVATVFCLPCSQNVYSIP
jgi:hypothetical protein